jgi:hypothetical protein
MVSRPTQGVHASAEPPQAWVAGGLRSWPSYPVRSGSGSKIRPRERPHAIRWPQGNGRRLGRETTSRSPASAAKRSDRRKSFPHKAPRARSWPIRLRRIPGTRFTSLWSADFPPASNLLPPARLVRWALSRCWPLSARHDPAGCAASRDGHLEGASLDHADSMPKVARGLGGLCIMGPM